jgi:CRP-like cAMP-binding protein
VVVREGDPGDALYLVVRGELGVIKGMDRIEEVFLGIIGQDDFFGELALIDHDPRSATVKTRADTVLLAVQADDFTNMIRDYPAIPMNVCKVLCQRIRALQARLKEPAKIRTNPRTGGKVR